MNKNNKDLTLLLKYKHLRKKFNLNKREMKNSSDKFQDLRL